MGRVWWSVLGLSLVVVAATVLIWWWLVGEPAAPAVKPLSNWKFRYDPGLRRPQYRQGLEPEARRAQEAVDMFLPEPRIIGIELFLRTNVDVWEEDGAQVMVAATIARSGEEPPRGLIALDYRSADAETIAIGLAEVKALAQEKKVPRAKLCGTGRYIVDPKGDEKLGTLNMLGDGDPIPKGKAKACLEWFAVAYEHELKGKKIPKLLVSDDPFWMPWTADKRVAPGFRAKFQELLAHRRTRSI